MSRCQEPRITSLNGNASLVNFRPFRTLISMGFPTCPKFPKTIYLDQRTRVSHFKQPAPSMVKVFFPDNIKEDEGYQLAHLHENRGPHVLITFAVLSALATISVGLRILVRWRTRSKIEADDHTIFLTLVCIQLPGCRFSQYAHAA